MRVTVSHNQPKQQVKDAVNQSFDDLFRGIGVIPLQLVNEQRSWSGDTLNFSFLAKVGFLSAPIKGSVEVTDRDLTIDADLGLLERLLPSVQTRAAIEQKVRGLLR